MTATNVVRPALPASDDANADRELLILSGMLDPYYYAALAGLGQSDDPASHYLDVGWREGLTPRPDFDPAFLAPYYAAAGRYGPPAMTWLSISVLPGRVPPRNKTEASWAIEPIRTSPHFAAADYAKRLPPGLDPLEHYVVIGELLGWMPSARLDPEFYLDRHPDVARLNLSPLAHYTELGDREGRKAVPAVARLAFPPLQPDGRPCVLLLVHDTSRTGAPILGWNIACAFEGRFNVVTVMMRGGALEIAFRDVSAAAVGPLTWADWHESEFERLACRLVHIYDPAFVIANSVETSALVPSLARRGIPIVALIHEFAAYVRPSSKLSDMLTCAAHIVFPAHLVAIAAQRAFPSLEHRRNVHVLSQGRPVVPGAAPVPLTLLQSRPWVGGGNDTFTVLGLGSVHMRKGVDLFIAAATVAVRLMPSVRFKFVWIGGGYDPVNDTSYSVYLAAQIMQSGLESVVEIRGEVDDLAPAYASADLFLLSSRLDPQPNVAIEAAILGLPTVCFEGASGTAEILAADPATRCLVVPHLDAHAAAEVICHFARAPAGLQTVRKEIARVGMSAYDMTTYVNTLERLGTAAASQICQSDLYELAATGAVDPDLAIPPGTPAAELLTVERQVLQQWRIAGLSGDQYYNKAFRRACPGFHPQAYATHHPACLAGKEDPLLHWLRRGRPDGPWSHPVLIGRLTEQTRPARSIVAVHAVIERASSIAELRQALAVNQVSRRLFLVVRNEEMAEHARVLLSDYEDEISVNVAEWIDPLHDLLNRFIPELTGQIYEIVLHVHDGDGADTCNETSTIQRQFLWENLIGPDVPMLDRAAAWFEDRPSIGLIMAEHPGLDGWRDTRTIAEALASRFSTTPVLPSYFDYPRGGMFVARASVLRAARDLVTLTPAEPAAENMYSAILRLLPLVAQAQGLAMGGLRVPGTTC